MTTDKTMGGEWLPFNDAAKRALAEEALAALYFIGAAGMFATGHTIIGWCLFTKACLDTLSALSAWGRKRPPLSNKDNTDATE